MGGYDVWLESPYRDAEHEAIEADEAKENEIDNITRQLRLGSLDQAQDYAFDHLNEESYEIVGRMLYEYSRNLNNASSPEFARLMVRLLESYIEKNACDTLGMDFDGDDYTYGVTK
jgi:hypothetical protein